MFPAYREQGSNRSKQLLYWDNFQTQIFQVIHDLTRSHRESNWELHLSAIRRALPLCFALGRVNYKRWLPFYYEYAVVLKERFPNMHARFSMGDFTVKYTKRSASVLPVDQVSKKAYNKSAKGSSGVIRITKRKEAVLKWNILEHLKMKYTNFLYDVCSMSDDDGYSIHYEFSSSARALNELHVQQIFDSISKHGNPFDLGSSSIRNLVTCSEVDLKLSAFLLKVIEVGETACNILKHLDFLRNQLNSLTLFQRDAPHKKHRLAKKTLPKKQSSS